MPHAATPAPPASAAGLSAAIGRTRDYLFARQAADGHWCGELQGDTILESEYLLLLAFLGRESDPAVPKLANYLLSQQSPDGGWSNYPGGPADVSVTVKAYSALKVAGHPADAPHMRRAAAAVRELGGAERCNSFTKFYLALLGQFPYDNCPSVPPELILLPTWAYVNLYAMSAWTRTIVVPLSIFSAYKPVRHLPADRGVRELFLDPPETPRPPHPPTAHPFTWTNFFLAVDRLVKKCEKWGLTPFRKRALDKAVAWVRDHYRDSDGVGAIFPPMIYTVVMLRCLGVPDDDPEMKWALQQLEDLKIEEGDTLRLQPCLSPVWDTTLTLAGVADAQAALGEPVADAPEVERAVEWLLSKECRQVGDWAVTNPDLEPGGWFFEYRNSFYPDTDDTAMGLVALARTGHAGRPAAKGAVFRATQWLLGMQNRDGGWAAFDRDIDRELLTKVPFADHNAMLDPSCPDITARVLEAFGHYGFRAGQGPVDRAVKFLTATQAPFGAWPGRWGVNYLYGTWQVLTGLRAVGSDMDAPAVRRAVDWLKGVQQPGGGWGESCASYDDPAWAGKGEATASQTAWAVLGLIAAGDAGCPEVRSGVDYLLRTQSDDGGWAEEPFTGTGFPKVFYLKYHLYPVYFPLMALSRYQKAVSG